MYVDYYLALKHKAGGDGDRQRDSARHAGVSVRDAKVHQRRGAVLAPPAHSTKRKIVRILRARFSLKKRKRKSKGEKDYENKTTVRTHRGIQQ